MTKKRKHFNYIIALCMTCMICMSSILIGRTYAYFSGIQSAQGSVMIGTLTLDSLNDNNSDSTAMTLSISDIMPSETVTKTYSASITSNIDYYIRILISSTTTPQTGKEHSTTCKENKEHSGESICEIAVTDSGYTKCPTLSADGSTAFYKMSPQTSSNQPFTISVTIKDWVGDDYCDYYMSANIKVTIKVQVVQADYLESEDTGKTWTNVNDLHILCEQVFGGGG